MSSAFKVEKLHSIPIIRNLATHGSPGKYKRKENEDDHFLAAAVNE